MRVNELMVGDVVKLHYGNGYKDEYREVIEEDFVNKCFTRCAKPIPITEELLEKLGFKKYVDVCWDFYRLKMGEYYATVDHISNTKGKNWSCHIDNEDFESVVNCDIEYLHQLQQIVRIATGKELEVVL